MKSRTRTLAATAAVVALTATACGDNDTAGQEAALERLIEAESGQDIDLDLDGDGGFSVQSEDGEFSINVDEEGNVVFDSDEGSGTFDADGDGGGTLEFDSEDGSGTVDIDGDGGVIVTGEDGETIVSEIDEESGSVVVQSDDGSTFESGSAIPSQWPADIPQPEGLTDVTGTYMGDATSSNIVTAGTPPGDPAAYLAAYVASLVAAGFTETSSFTTESNISYTHERDGILMSSGYTDLGATGQIVVSISTF